MPHRPPHSPIKDLVVQPPPRDITTKSPFVVTSVSMLNTTTKPDLSGFKPLSSHLANPQQEAPRPSTSQGVVKQPRRMSFSRPLTSDGPKPDHAPAVPKLPTPIQTQVSDPANIGVAVGSPTQYGRNSPKIPKNTGLRRPMRANTDEPVIPFVSEWSVNVQPQVQPKLKRWRSVGGLFKKKKAAAVARPPSPIYDEEETTQKLLQGHTREVKAAPVAAPQAEKFPTRKSSLRPRFRSRSFSKYTEPKITTAPPDVPHKPFPPANPVPHHVSSPQAQPRPSASSGPWSDFQEEVRKRHSKPKLDVSIPSTEFERYSVMFSGLLTEPLTRGPPTPSPRLVRTDVEHGSVTQDGATPLESTRQDTKARPRDVPVTSLTGADLPRPAPVVNTSARDSQGSSNAASTPKAPGYSLFPAVKPSPVISPSLSPQLRSASRSDTPDSTGPALKAPSPTPNPHFVTSASLSGDHILSQHAGPAFDSGSGLGLQQCHAPLVSRQAVKHVPSPLAQIEPRNLRSPDFSPDSPVSRASTSSTWSYRPSISYLHQRAKSSGNLGHSPGPSVSSYMDSYHTAPQEQSVAQPLDNDELSRKSPATPAREFKQPRKSSSPQLGYGAPTTPKIGVARKVSVTSSAQRPQFLERTSSKKAKEETASRAKLQEHDVKSSTPRMVTMDNSDRPDEETWLQRRSRWGVIEEGGRVVC